MESEASFYQYFLWSSMHCPKIVQINDCNSQAATFVDLGLFVILYLIYSSVKEKQNFPTSQVCGESKGKQLRQWN